MEECKGITLKGTKCRRKSIQDYCWEHSIKNNHRECKPVECLVCYESLTNQKYALDCGHWIHTECIINSAKAECPLCRKIITLGKRNMNKLEKIAKKRKIETLQQEEDDLRAGLQEHMTGVIRPLLEENIEEIVGFLFDENMVFDEEMYEEFLNSLF